MGRRESFPPVFQVDSCVFQPFVDLAFQGTVLETLMELVVRDATLIKPNRHFLYAVLSHLRNQLL